MPAIKHGTLTPSTVATVTIDGDFAYVEVVNVNGLGPVYALVDSGATDPTVAGDDTEVLPAAIGSVTLAAPGIDKSAPIQTQVKLISAAAAQYAVCGR